MEFSCQERADRLPVKALSSLSSRQDMNTLLGFKLNINLM